MDLRVADPLNILDVDAELANVADDLRRGVEGAVDQHVTSRRREQDARDPVSADVVRVAEDGEGSCGAFPSAHLGQDASVWARERGAARAANIATSVKWETVLNIIFMGDL